MDTESNLNDSHDMIDDGQSDSGSSMYSATDY